MARWRLSNAAVLFERLRSYNAGVVLAAQSIEGLHDDPAERDRLLNSASTLIAHRLADPDPIVTRAGTIRRPDQRPSLDDGPDAVAAEPEVSADAVEEGTPMGSSDSLAAAQPAPPGTVPVR